MSDKLILNQDETNELSFTIHVQGMSTEPDAAKPVFRFVIFEKGKENSNGYIYAGNKNSDSEDNVIVSITPLKGQYNESKDYIGKMEVILGSRYFITATLDISFEKPFAIKAELVKKEQKPDFQVKVESVNNTTHGSTIEKQVQTAEAKTGNKEKHSKTVTIDDLDDISEIYDLISEKKSKEDVVSKKDPVHEKKNSSLKADENGMVEITKSQLMRLMEIKKKAKEKQEIKSIIKDALR